MATATGVTWQQGNRLLESVDYARQIVFKNGFVRVRAPDYRTSVAEGRADNQEKTFDVPANHRYEVLGAAQYNFVHSRGADSCSYILVRPSRPSAPPNIPSAADARTQLAGLTVAAQGPQTSYSRDLFPHWIRQSGTCNTRETVLKRDGTDVVTDSACTSTSRSWYSPYDDATWTAASDVDIDRMVPLSNAWKSGAASWTTARRQAFANDLTNPQLLAVTDNVNQSKGDQGPETWKPSLTSYHCTYSRMWIEVKSVYALTITSAEKSALTTMLETC